MDGQENLDEQNKEIEKLDDKFKDQVTIEKANDTHILKRDEDEKPEHKHQGLISAVSYLLTLVFFVFVLVSCFNYYYAVYPIQGTSMSPTISPGDIIYVNKRVDIERGDIMVIYVDGEDFLIKRVIALGGDEIYCQNSVLYLKKAGETDFSVVEESKYLDYAWTRNNNFAKMVIPENQVFFMGDNRNDSKDSRELGTQSVDNVVGPAPAWSFWVKTLAGKIYSFAQSVNK